VNDTRILIAEDEPDIRELLRLQLEAAGYEVIEARDGQQAVEYALLHRPDLALLDVMMPKLDGFEVCRRLRAAFETRSMPIIMLTAKVELVDRLSGLDGGANDYVTKPWATRELLLRIRNMLDWSRQQRSMSPLTGLPGNLSIQSELSRRIAAHEAFAMLQVDIDFFKAFNDYYGYARGDEAIQRLAAILVDASARLGGSSGFVGHIGGDDFVVVVPSEHAEAVGHEIIAQFTEAVPTLYDEADVRRGHIEVHNRLHVPERFPMMSLTIAMVCTDRLPITHVAQLIDVAQELKEHGKGIPGSVLVGERRRGDAADSARDVA
jgi:diguanylate cyclase (GGDEF)-like protein